MAYSRSEGWRRKTMWTFEPSAAMHVFEEMIRKENGIDIVFGERLERKKMGVNMDNQFITSSDDGKRKAIFLEKYLLMPLTKGI